jgi:HTH-type transcriptional regulator/antitoxin HigA
MNVVDGPWEMGRTQRSTTVAWKDWMTERAPAEVFSPGEVIRKELDARDWKQADLAEILGRPLPVVNGILSGKTGISPETAKGLAAAFGTSPELWLHLDATYQLSRVPGEAAARIAERARLYARAPVREMTKRGWIAGSRNAQTLEGELLRFFRIKRIEDRARLWHAERSPATPAAMPPQVEAWLVRGLHMAESIRAAVFSPRSMRALIDELRLLLTAPEQARRAPDLLASGGIRMAVIEPLAKTRVDGACLWLDKSAPVVVLSLRSDRIGTFWHTLMHELAHVRQGDGLRANLPVDLDLFGDVTGDSRPRFEQEAEAFAASALVRRDGLEDFIRRAGPHYPKAKVAEFARHIQVHPGIVAEQLQLRGEVPPTHFRQFFVPVRSHVIRAAPTDGWNRYR